MDFLCSYNKGVVINNYQQIYHKLGYKQVMIRLFITGVVGGWWLVIGGWWLVIN